MLQGGKDNLIENNVFVDGAYSQVYVANCENNSTGLRFQRNIVAYAAPDAALFACGRVDQEVIRIDRNLYFPPGGKTPALRGCPSLAAWQKQGFDRNSLVADPRFVDPAHDNYALKLDSPAFQLGFQPIDTSRVGLLHDRCRCPICPAAAYFGLAGPHPPTP